MCRIAGILNYQSPPNASNITLFRDAMHRGGPDDVGIYLDDELPLAFGHRRLSLLDLSPLGHQPMFDVSKKVVIIFNGEIYNFKEIKEQLLGYGHQFISNSDTEVIIYAYLQWGTDCFNKFDGMFAFALLDKRINKMFLVRDYAGIKPLYYSCNSSSVYFASEIRAFKTINNTWQENEDWKKYFLMFGHLPEPITTLKNVQPLKKGHFLEIDVNTLQTKQHKYFQIYYNYTINNTEEATQKIHDTLIQSVKRHLISDAPIGLFLSGGLDSSLLTILAKPFIPDSLHTLSIVFENEKYSEKYYQDIVIKQTNAHHQSFLVTENLFKESLDDIIDAMDQPSNDGINSYFICKYAKEYGLKAVLSGLGADELFGGYQSFYRTKNLQYLRYLPNFMFKVANIFPDDRRKKISFLGVENGLGEYLFNRGFFTPTQVAMLLDCSVSEIKAALISIKNILPNHIDKFLPQEKVSYLETNLYMQNQLLKDTDYMSMWHSVEVRVPFLDKNLMQLAYSINPDIRYNKHQVKHLLIEAFKKELPKEVWQRNKQGFIFPFEQWMQQLVPNQNITPTIAHLKKGLENGNIHWSRYWSYLLTQNTKAALS